MPCHKLFRDFFNMFIQLDKRFQRDFFEVFEQAYGQANYFQSLTSLKEMFSFVIISIGSVQ